MSKAKVKNTTTSKSADLVTQLAEAQANSGAVIAVIDAVSKARTSGDAAVAALSTVKEAFGWAYGSFWSVDKKENVPATEKSSLTIPKFFRGIK